MPKLTIMRGISGSGKSTFAQNLPGIKVSRDTLREAFFPMPVADYYRADKDVLRERENTITRIQDATIESLLRAGKDVVVDNTNIEWKYVKALANIGYACGADVELKVVDVDVHTATARDLNRKMEGGRYVGHEVIFKQYRRFQGTKDKQLDPPHVVKPYHGTPGKPKAFLVDIDGTLAHMTTRGPFDWKRVGEDHLDEIVAEIVKSLAAGSDYKVIIMSGRDSACRRETIKWLIWNGLGWYDELFMRAEGDMRKDNIVKAELFDKHVRDNFDVDFVLDDRDQVVRMWRQMGLTCLQVAEGKF